jgi:ribosomal protein S18 acetylase RimI-like enzyme
VKVSFDARLSVAPDVVWKALTDPALTRRYYFGMSVESDWTRGGRIAYTFAPGQAGESGTITDIEPGRRLALETRLLFAEELRSQPPHKTTWDLEPSADGTRVKLTYDIPERAALTRKLFAEDGDVPLAGLRVTVDPEARAELARMPEIGRVEIHDLTRERLDDYLHFFDEEAFRDYPAWSNCYCSETHLPNTDAANALRTGSENREYMTGLIGAGQVTALLAYVDGRPAGWCNYGETTQLAGVMRKLGIDAADHDGVGSIACFVIAAPYRRHGIAEKLLAAACERLARRGIRTVEAYPRRDPDFDGAAYRGPLQMYEAAGFEPYREAGRHVIVRKQLA